MHTGSQKLLFAFVWLGQLGGLDVPLAAAGPSMQGVTGTSPNQAFSNNCSASCKEKNSNLPSFPMG